MNFFTYINNEFAIWHADKQNLPVTSMEQMFQLQVFEQLLPSIHYHTIKEIGQHKWYLLKGYEEGTFE